MYRQLKCYAAGNTVISATITYMREHAHAHAHTHAHTQIDKKHTHSITHLHTHAHARSQYILVHVPDKSEPLCGVLECCSHTEVSLRGSHTEVALLSLTCSVHDAMQDMHTRNWASENYIALAPCKQPY